MPELTSASDRAEARESNTYRLENYLGSDRFADQLKQLLPAHLDTDRFATIAFRQVRLIPELNLCPLESVAAAIMQAGTLGLEIATQGEAWIIPRQERVKGSDRKQWQASLQVGYLGYLALAWRSEQVASVLCDVVAKGDPFDFQRGTNGYLHHKPAKGRELSEKTIEWAYAVVKTTHGGEVWMCLDHVQIERLRNAGPSANSPAWKNWYDQMAMGKSLKRTLKFCPKSRQMARAISLDDQLDAGVQQDLTIDLPALAPAASVSPAEEAMRQAAGQTPPDEEPPPPEDEREPVMAQRAEPAPEPQRAEQAPAPSGDKPGPLGF